MDTCFCQTMAWKLYVMNTRIFFVQMTMHCNSFMPLHPNQTGQERGSCSKLGSASWAWSLAYKKMTKTWCTGWALLPWWASTRWRLPNATTQCWSCSTQSAYQPTHGFLLHLSISRLVQILRRSNVLVPYMCLRSPHSTFRQEIGGTQPPADQREKALFCWRLGSSGPLLHSAHSFGFSKREFSRGCNHSLDLLSSSFGPAQLWWKLFSKLPSATCSWYTQFPSYVFIFFQLFPVMAVIPFLTSLDIQGLKHSLNLVRSRVESKPEFAPVRIDYILICLTSLLDVG